MVNSIRFSGLASGLDTQSIVDSLMMAERIPLNKIYQKKQLLEWKRDDYRSMNLLLKELDDFIFDGIYKKSKMIQRTVTSSNPDFLTATASADAANVSYDIGNVRLATAARKQTEFKVLNGDGQEVSVGVSGLSDEKIDPSKSLWSQQNKFLNGNQFDWEEETIKDTLTVPEKSNGVFQLSKRDVLIEAGTTINVGTNTFTVRTELTSDNPLAADEVYVDQSTGKMTFGANIENVAAGSTFEVSFTNHYLNLDIKTYDESGKAQYQSFKFDGSTSLNDVFSRINKSEAGVNFFYDNASDKVVAMRTETGNFNPAGDEIEFVALERDEEGNVIVDGEGNVNELAAQDTFFTKVLGLGKDIEGTGTDATFTINGLETSRKSNTFTLNGVTFTLKKDSVDSGDSATINIQTNTDAIVETITDFVNKYNEIIGKINAEISEERYRDYQPLTNEEKEALSEDEIKRWEEKARSGMLRRDSLLSGALDKLRLNLYGEVISNDTTLTNSKYNQLAEIGIKTTINYLDRGKLEIDEEKLRAAIEDDPDAIYQLFMADGDSYEEQGLARRLRDTISSTIDSIEERAGNSYKTSHSYTMGKQLLDIEDQIDSFERRLAATEQRYWKQFNAMEAAMQKLNEQSNTLLSYLGMGSQ